MKLMRTACALGLILLFAACIPASPPANVGATPGAAAIVTQDRYQNDVFSVTYPTGWRVITSPAGAPPSVTFVAPGDCGLVIVTSAPLKDVPHSPACNADFYYTVDKRKISLGDNTITVAASAPDAEWATLHDQMDRIAASLKAAL
ncbi:MAG: hypothetical protein ABI700_20230 [Chloroflexota bacterium]